MIGRQSRTLFMSLLLVGFFSQAISADKHNENTDTQAEDVVSAGDDALTGNFELGEERYNQTCVNCHGAAGKGVASFPKVSGNEISYTKSRLETYRDGIKIGSNSSLMIMMARPLTDEDIANLAVYLKEATN